MKPELAVRVDETIGILRKGFTHDELTKRIIPLLSGVNRTLFPEDEEDKKVVYKKGTRVEEMVALLKEHFTQQELEEIIIPRLEAPSEESAEGAAADGGDE